MIDAITTVDDGGAGSQAVASTPREIRRERRTRAQLPPTPRQMDALRYVAAYIEAHGYGPRLADIARHLDVVQVTAFEHVEGLVARGLLDRHRSRSRSRGLTVTPAGVALLCGPCVRCPSCGHRFRTREPMNSATGSSSEPERPAMPGVPALPFEAESA